MSFFIAIIVYNFTNVLIIEFFFIKNFSDINCIKKGLIFFLLIFLKFSFFFSLQNYFKSSFILTQDKIGFVFFFCFVFFKIKIYNNDILNLHFCRNIMRRAIALKTAKIYISNYNTGS